MAFADDIRTENFNPNTCADLLEDLLVDEVGFAQVSAFSPVGSFTGTANDEITASQITITKNANDNVLVNLSISVSCSSGTRQVLLLYKNGSPIGGYLASEISKSTSTSGDDFNLAATFLDETSTSGSTVYSIGLAHFGDVYYTVYNISAIPLRRA